MVDISSAVLWWDAWQLRILVLGSLACSGSWCWLPPCEVYYPGLVPEMHLAGVHQQRRPGDLRPCHLFNRHARGSSACQ
jgi:hypothetical protein